MFTGCISRTAQSMYFMAQTYKLFSNRCPFLHRTSGDTERRYHLRYYKTGICVYDTDSRGYCVKNGQHCAFAHGIHDLRNPVYDVRELQAMEGGGDGLGGENGPNPLDKERNALNDDPRWNESAYVLAFYKTELCKRPPRLCRQGYACPQYHNSKDKRRTPRKFKYRSTPCPNVKQGDEWGDPANCEAGDNCSYCHTRTEQQFHPEIYKSTKCNDVLQTKYCPRGPFCAFAHGDLEMQTRHELMNEDLDLKNLIPNNNGTGNNPSPVISRTMSCSAGTLSRGSMIASSLPDSYPGMTALLSHSSNNNTAFGSKGGGDSILGAPSPSSSHGPSLLGPGSTAAGLNSNLGAIGTRPRSYSTSASASMAHTNHMDQFFSRMNASKNASRIDSHEQDHSSEQRTASSSGHRRSSGVFDAAPASSPLFAGGRFGSNDLLGTTITNVTSSSSRGNIATHESYSTAETVGSVVESAIGCEVDATTFDDLETTFDFHPLVNRTTTSTLVNGNDVLLDHHHPNQQQPHHVLGHSSSRTDPVNIPGARLTTASSTDRTLNCLNNTSPPFNASPSLGGSFSQFGLSPFPRTRTDTGLSTQTVAHNNSQASSVVDSFLPALSSSPQGQSLVQAAASILEIQRLKEELSLSRAKNIEYESRVQQVNQVS